MSGMIRLLPSLLLLICTKTTLAFSPTFINRRILCVDSALSSTEDDATTNSESKGVVPAEPGSHEELMYTLGVNLARQLGDVRPMVESGEEMTYVAKGLLDTVVGRLEEEDQLKLLQSRVKDLNELITDRANKIRQGIETAGQNMLDTMASTEGVEVLPSGVCVHILEEGDEDDAIRPTAASTVKAHYHGTLADGSVFDSSLGQKDPLTFAVGAVIPGWKEGLLKMKKGQTAMIGIPKEHGYGDEGSPDGRIPGGAVLFLKVQLIDVLSAGIGGGPTLLGADGKKLSKSSSGSGLLGADGKPL